MIRLNQLEGQLAQQQVAKKPVELGPAPPARKNRPHIMLMVKPDTVVRREVPQSYIDAKLPGWDGNPVKGYLFHEDTLRRR